VILQIGDGRVWNHASHRPVDEGEVEVALIVFIPIIVFYSDIILIQGQAVYPKWLFQ